MLGCGDPGLRLFLKGVQNVHACLELDRKDDTVRPVTPMGDELANAESLKRPFAQRLFTGWRLAR